MSSTSFDRLLRGSLLALPGTREDSISADHSIRMTRADRDRLEGKIKGGRSNASAGGGGKRPGLSRKMDKRTPMRGAAFGDGARSGQATMSFDNRQRAIVKIHYFNPGPGGGAALKAHAAYVAPYGRNGRPAGRPYAIRIVLSTRQGRTISPPLSISTMCSWREGRVRGGDRRNAGQGPVCVSFTNAAKKLSPHLTHTCILTPVTRRGALLQRRLTKRGRTRRLLATGHAAGHGRICTLSRVG